MASLPTELHEQILSYLPFADLLRLRRVSRLFNTIVFHLLAQPRNLTTWSITLTTSSGHFVTIPLDHQATRPAHSWSEIYRRPYIFSGPISGVTRTDHAQVLKFRFWDRALGADEEAFVEECRFRNCGLVDVTVWPWSTLPVCRTGPLGEVIRWRDLYKVELWESHWDPSLSWRKRQQQHIGAPFHEHPPQVQQLQGPPVVPLQNGFVNVFMGQAVQMTENGHIAVPGVPGTSFAPNRCRVALSYSAICGFLVVQRRIEWHKRGVGEWDPVAAAVQDPRMREAGLRARIGCGCKLINWEHEDLGIRMIRLDESETNTFDRFR